MKKTHAGIPGYREIAEPLTATEDMGFTHIEFMPLAQHAFYPPGVISGHRFYAPDSRYGTRTTSSFFVNHLHRAGIVLLLDWVPAHFSQGRLGFGKSTAPPFTNTTIRAGANNQIGARSFSTMAAMSPHFLIANALFLVRTLSYRRAFAWTPVARCFTSTIPGSRAKWLAQPIRRTREPSRPWNFSGN